MALMIPAKCAFNGLPKRVCYTKETSEWKESAGMAASQGCIAILPQAENWRKAVALSYFLCSRTEAHDILSGFGAI